MLVAWIGLPSSGKTTVSTSMFSQFKLSAQNCELILEEARRYISEYRFKNNLQHNSLIQLTDQDQIEIANRQFNIEKYFKHSCGPNTIIISDSSVFNSLLYMSEDFLIKEKVKEFFFEKLKGHYDLLFYCFPVDHEYLPSDSNRVHDKEQLKLLSEKAKLLLNEIKNHNIPVEVLLNDSESRIREASSLTLNKYCKILESTPNKEFQVL